jgi:hypothetical protein
MKDPEVMASSLVGILYTLSLTKLSNFEVLYFILIFIVPENQVWIERLDILSINSP